MTSILTGQTPYLLRLPQVTTGAKKKSNVTESNFRLHMKPHRPTHHCQQTSDHLVQSLAKASQQVRRTHLPCSPSPRRAHRCLQRTDTNHLVENSLVKASQQLLPSPLPLTLQWVSRSIRQTRNCETFAIHPPLKYIQRKRGSIAVFSCPQQLNRTHCPLVGWSV